MLAKTIRGLFPVEFFFRAVRGWNHFWFNPADPTLLGAIRLLAGFLTLYVHIAYTYDLHAFFGERAWIDLPILKEYLAESPNYGPPVGWQPFVPEPPKTPEEHAYVQRWEGHPGQAWSKGQYRWSIWFHVTDPAWMWAVHGSMLLCCFFFAIGFCTRLSGTVTYILAMSYIQRAQTALFGMDTMMNITLLYLVIGPSGAALSVDRLIRRYWDALAALRQGKPVPPDSGPEPSVSANLAIRLLQVNLCFVYLVAGISKLQGNVWWTGQAAWLTMANWEFSPMQSPLYMEFLRLISSNRLIWESVMTFGTYFTLAFEISFPYLVWQHRLRWTMISAAVLMHLGIAICMGLVTFSMFMLIMVLSFVPVSLVKNTLGLVGRRFSSALQPA